MLSRFLTAFLLALFITPALAAPGDLDLSFGGTGKVATAVGSNSDTGAHSVIQQADGKLVVAGNSYFSDSSSPVVSLVRYNIDGSLDSSFDGDGKLNIDIAGQSYKMIQQADGKLVVVGYSNVGGQLDLALLRLNADGTFDSSFDVDGKVITDIAGYDESAYSVIQQADDKLVVVGEGCVPDCHPLIVRYNADGTLDSDFDGDGTLVINTQGAAYDVIQQLDGKLVFAVNGGVVRYNSDGTLDQTFATNGKFPVSNMLSVIQQADGNLVIGSGPTGYYNTVKLLRLDDNGILDISFSGDGEVSVDLGHAEIGAQANCVYRVGSICADTIYRVSLIQQADAQFVIAALGSKPFQIKTFHSDGSLNNSFVIDRPPPPTCVEDPINLIICSPNSWEPSLNDDSAAFSLVQQFDGKLVAVGRNNDDEFAIRRYESGQVDTDNDGTFDELDADDDDDGLLDTADNCSLVSNADQLNIDGDAQGDVCDSDNDNDGVPDVSDRFPLNAAASLDTDNDGYTNSWNVACDTACQTNSGLILDNCPLTTNADQLNTDGDTQGDACDSDDDNDGALDVSDNCPLVVNLNQSNNDGDSLGDTCDADDDNDGVADISDNCLFFPNANQLNTDGDAQGDVCDNDDDNDGVADASDKFPLNSNESVDWDADGIGNNADADDDNDGVLDISDNCHWDVNPGQADDDHDGIGNACDSDGPGKLDITFNPFGPNGVVRTVAIQNDGKILIGGSFTLMNNVPVNRIARLNSDSSLDTNFNPGAGANADIYSVVQQPDGKILISGDFTSVSGVSINRIARLNSDGSRDSGFNPNGGANNSVSAMALQSDGKVLIVGYFTTINGVTRNRIARLNSDGSLDTSFNSGASSFVSSIVLQPDGKVLIGGYFSSVNSVARNNIARLNSNGSLDANFNIGTGVNGSVLAMALQADGKILVGGSFSAVRGLTRNNIARLNSNGSLDSSFSPTSGTDSAVGAMSIQADGKVLVGGDFNMANGKIRMRIARFNSDGLLDLDFNSWFGPGGAIYKIAVQADGKLNIAGDFSATNNQNMMIYGIARIHTGDVDQDGIEDAADFDRDNDGVADISDAFPLDATESVDADGDGIGDNADTDDDNDGVNDTNDAFPFDSNESVDTDADGIGDNSDNCGVDANADQLDTDTDGAGDVCDSTPNGDDDSDNVDNATDNCLSVSNSDQLNTDGDSEGDECDSDDDNDGVLDTRLLVNPVAVSAGYRHTCAIDDTGVQCWGYNGDGETDVPVLNNPTAVSAGFQHTCAIDDTGVHCWGYSEDGQTDVPVLNNPTAVSTGHRHSCAIDNTGVHCWGAHWYGQTNVPVLNNPTSVSAGSYHTCALDSTGVHCWGNNDLGQITVPALVNPVAVSAGYRHTCAIDDTGVRCWGYNGHGETDVPALVNPVAVSAGFQHTCAIDDTGVRCWGYNGSGETDAPSLVNPVAVSAGVLYTCAIDDTGVHCWGDAYYGKTNVSGDNCQLNSNIDQLDTDGDGQGDACDSDDDNDNVADTSDAFPLDATESVDTDSDGIGDNADTTPNGDDDGDDVDNAADNCPLIANSNQLDYDADNIGDACDEAVPLPEDIAGVMKNAKAGSAVAFAGDVNGDGYGDYVIGMPGYDIPAAPPLKTIQDAGRAEVISGKTGAVLMSVNGVAAKDAMGFAVAGNGDIDNDGFDDVLVGAPNADDFSFGLADVGSTTILFGPNGNRTKTFIGKSRKSLSGSAVALADVNGDNHADIIIGAPKADDVARSLVDAGNVTVISGNGYSVLNTLYVAKAKANAGTSVAAGDINHDGNADIIIGAPNDDDATNKLKDAGSVSVYDISGTELLRKYGVVANAHFGKSVASGDVNNDGVDDVLVGAPDDDNGKIKDVGSVTVYSGSDSSPLIKKYGLIAKVNLGNSVTAGDVNADGYADIIAGAWKDDSPTVPKITKDTGSVSVWSGNGYALINTVYGDAAHDYFGSAVSAGDINRDGKFDLIIGIPGFGIVMKDTGGVKVLSGAGLGF